MGQPPETERAFLEILSKVDPILNPIELAELFPAYRNFIPHRKGYGLWSTLESLPLVMQRYLQQDNVILELSGVAAGGKDAIREQIQKLVPNLLFKAVTATSRKPREGEKHGVDYYFYDGPESFMAAVKREEFIEWVAQGERLYGMPEQSLRDAIVRPEPVVVTHVEMASGWPSIDKFAKSGAPGKAVFPLKVFVLPNMKFSEYAKEWLPERREDVDTRLLRTAWEISVAANCADFIITNTISHNYTPLEWEAQTLINHCVMLLKSERAAGFSTFKTPFDISCGIDGRQPVVDYHRAMLGVE